MGYRAGPGRVQDMVNGEQCLIGAEGRSEFPNVRAELVRAQPSRTSSERRVRKFFGKTKLLEVRAQPNTVVFDLGLQNWTKRLDWFMWSNYPGAVPHTERPGALRTFRESTVTVVSCPRTLVPVHDELLDMLNQPHTSHRREFASAAACAASTSSESRDMCAQSRRVGAFPVSFTRRHARVEAASRCWLLACRKGGNCAESTHKTKFRACEERVIAGAERLFRDVTRLPTF
ncbi:hypothetical protein B0H11DRAFT_1932542 [Mycena galericulata]|nr:hypothetical protein B0H11DRAFT_1932542 [Mycena galericulata]